MTSVGSNVAVTVVDSGSSPSIPPPNGGDWINTYAPPTTVVTPMLPYFGNGSVGFTVTETHTPSAPLFKFAVDYIDDAPVYGYARAGTFAVSTDVSNTEAAYQTNTSYGASQTLTNSRTYSGSAADPFKFAIGIKTDFADITIPAPSFSRNSTYDTALALVLPAQNDIADFGTVNYTSGTYSRDHSATQSSDIHLLNLIYLDLRQQWLVYEVQRTIGSETISSSTSQTLTGGDTGLTFDETTVTGATFSVNTVVQKGADVLLNDTVTDPPVSATSTTTYPVVYTDPITSLRQTIIPATSPPGVNVSFWNFDQRPPANEIDDGAPGTSTVNYQDFAQWCPALTPRRNVPSDSDGRSWRADQNNALSTGSWTEYNKAWVFSMGLARNGVGFADGSNFAGYPNPEPAERWGNGILNSDLPTIVTGKSEKWVAGVNTGIIAPPFDLFFPISVIAPTLPLV